MGTLTTSRGVCCVDGFRRDLSDSKMIQMAKGASSNFEQRCLALFAIKFGIRSLAIQFHGIRPKPRSHLVSIEAPSIWIGYWSGLIELVFENAVFNPPGDNFFRGRRSIRLVVAALWSVFFQFCLICFQFCPCQPSSTMSISDTLILVTSLLHLMFLQLRRRSTGIEMRWKTTVRNPECPSLASLCPFWHQFSTVDRKENKILQEWHGRHENQDGWVHEVRSLERRTTPLDFVFSFFWHSTAVENTFCRCPRALIMRPCMAWKEMRRHYKCRKFRWGSLESVWTDCYGFLSTSEQEHTEVKNFNF